MKYFTRLLSLSLIPLPISAMAVTFVGYTGKVWQEDFGVVSNRCDAAKVAEIVSAGIGSRVSTVMPDGLLKSTLKDTGDAQALSIDAACLGHTLELVPSGQSVTWKNPVSTADFYVTPKVKTADCRVFSGIVVHGNQKHRFAATACSSSPGQWQVKP